MCFSAEVSFTSAALLGAAGFYLGHMFWGDRRFLVAITPLLFAVQQFAEGWLWVGLTDHGYPQLWSLFAEYVYLFFAYMFWPVWVPFAGLVAERVPERKKWLKLVLGLGLLLFIFNGIFLIHSYPITASVVGNSIGYGPAATLLALIYGFVVISPFFITSISRMKFVGFLVALFFVIAFFAYTYAFTSLWCFAAALTTLLFLIALKKDICA